MRVPAGPTDWSWRTRPRRPRGKSAVDSDVVDAMGGHPVDARSRVDIRTDDVPDGINAADHALSALLLDRWAQGLSALRVRLVERSLMPMSGRLPVRQRRAQVALLGGAEMPDRGDPVISGEGSITD